MSTPPGQSSPGQTNEPQHASSADATAALASPELERVLCMGCGYNLKGLALTSKCPECGVAAQDSLEFARNLGGLTHQNVLFGLRVHAIVALLSAVVFVLALAAPVFALAALLLWILFTVGTCHLADLEPSSPSRIRTLAFFLIVISTLLTALSPFIVISSRMSSSVGFLFLLIALGNALQFFFIYNRHSAISDAFAKHSASSIPTLFPAFTILIHGIVGLPLVIILSITLMLSERAAAGPGMTIIYSLPFHGLWLIWLGIRSAYYAKKLSRWSFAPSSQLPD